MFLCLSLALVSASESSRECDAQERAAHPILCQHMDRLLADPIGMSRDIHAWAEKQGLLVDISKQSSKKLPSVAVKRRLGELTVPVVFAHGMGDSCFNDGMQHIVNHTASLLGGVYSTCIPTGKSQSEDTSNSYFLNMDASVHIFADSVRANHKLRNGFHAIGFSQGNNVIRGYIAKCNDPPVRTFISVNGVNAGVGAVPYCRPKHVIEEEEETIGFSMCDLLMEQASRRAYTAYAQEHLFQANYWRDPRPVEAEAYRAFAQLAQWNNEGHHMNHTLNANWAKTDQYVWILAEQDSMVWPKEGEHWGAPDPSDPFRTILPMKETEWYQKDLFGLKTAEEAGKNIFLSFDGDHLQFSMKEYDEWIIKYLSK